jgi:predicted nucleotidyltransferase
MQGRAVDLGSASPDLVDDPRGALELLSERAGIRFERIATTRRVTAAAVADKRKTFANLGVPAGTSIVMFGSWARGELTPGSDNDWAVVVRSLEPDDSEIERALEFAQAELGGGAQRPGSQDVFGVAFDVATLVERIGLDADINQNLTRRMLLLLESVELAGSVHAECWQMVLDRYLRFGVKDFRPPRFLLNDLVRYWRTICVDFEGKHAETGTDDPKWLTRNAKLRTSRKLLFAGGLVPVLLCRLRPECEMRRFLTAWLTAPPTDRLAAAFLYLEAVEAGARTLAAYDRWLAIMLDEGARRQLQELRTAGRYESALWHEIRTIGEELQRGLLSLLFDTPLRAVTPHYAIF